MGYIIMYKNISKVYKELSNKINLLTTRTNNNKELKLITSKTKNNLLLITAIALIAVISLPIANRIQEQANALYPTPTITDITPNNGPIEGNTTTTINGDGFMTNSTFLQVATGDSHTLAIDSNGDLWGWGYNSYGEANGNGVVNEFPNGAQPVATQIKPGTKFS